MIQLKIEKVEKIVTCDSCKTVETIINNAIWDLQDEGIVNDVIMEFIQKLDVSLLLYKCDREAIKEINNIKFAREMLMHKILNGIDI